MWLVVEEGVWCACVRGAVRQAEGAERDVGGGKNVGVSVDTRTKLEEREIEVLCVYPITFVPFE